MNEDNVTIARDHPKHHVDWVFSFHYYWYILWKKSGCSVSLPLDPGRKFSHLTKTEIWLKERLEFCRKSLWCDLSKNRLFFFLCEEIADIFVSLLDLSRGVGIQLMRHIRPAVMRSAVQVGCVLSLDVPLASRGAVPPGFNPLRRGWVYRSAPEAPLLRGMPTAFWKCWARVGYGPAPGPTLKKALCHTLPVGGTEDKYHFHILSDW